MNRWLWSTWVLVITVVTFFAAGWLLQRARTPSSAQFGQLFEDVVERIGANYVDTLSRADLYRLAIEGLLDRLDDPYADFLDSTDLQEVRVTTRGEYGGLGIEVDVRDGWLTIVAPFPDSPAEHAGLRPGDRIVDVDGASTEGWSSDDAVAALRGTPGSTVTIVVRRGSRPPFTVTVERAEIRVSSVRNPMLLDATVGYVQLSPVRSRSADELGDAVDSLTRAGMQGLILDLRSNPGGVLEAAIETSDLFLDAGDEIAAQRGRVVDEVFLDTRGQSWPDLKIVVLVNQFTASAAEIIAGALQDHDRALVIGNRTFGKGLVQGVFRLSAPDAALKITTARWLTPSGRSIHRSRNSAGEVEAELAVVDTFHTEGGRVVLGGGGIIPDVEVPSRDFGEGERALFEALAGAVNTYRGVLTSEAVAIVDETDVGPDYVPPLDRVENVFERLAAQGVRLSAAERLTSRGFVTTQLGTEVVRFAVGGTAARRRQLDRDEDVREAARRLRMAETPAALLAPAREP